MGEQQEATSTFLERAKQLLSIVPVLAGAISFGVLILAFMHEWAFYYVLGGQYQMLLGVTDYFNSAIGWLPWFALGFVTTSIFWLFDSKSGVSQALKDEFYKANRTWWFFDNLPVWSLIALGLFGGLFQLLIGDWYTRGALELLFFVIWTWMLARLAKRESYKRWRTKEVIYLGLFIPGFLVMAYTTGMTEAADFLSPKREANAIGRLKNQYTERDWVVLRALSSGLLVRDLTGKQDRLRFIRWDDVAALETKIVQPNRNGLVCRVGGYLCRSPN